MVGKILLSDAIDTKNDLWKQVLGEILVGFKVTHFVSM
jgi:hypothetical protein